ncbi:hypothetical protein J437_LFUL002417 [Ladona fulva]|uniref:Uncharacterized protein n=1 Tax=Ladona fulva TaxID=123851 RepID=A0A8K0KP06_LADFU|nr:hypothetical protein J437_LFUL002417 [Ladona fulva]
MADEELFPIKSRCQFMPKKPDKFAIEFRSIGINRHNLMNYQVKKNKYVLLLSTMYSNVITSETNKRKPGSLLLQQK